MHGTVKTLTRDRMFGFIRAEDGVDYFFHESELHGGIVFQDVQIGEKVTFVPMQGEKGPRAVDVRLAA